MKILIISGFLGSGKTSFIKAMAKATQREFVIVENEFGELGIDGKLLKEEFQGEGTDAEMKIWELSEGCICCSLNLDFSMSVLTIYNALHPDYLIVEPSGVAMLSSILQQLEKIRYGDIEILAPVTILDYENFALHKHDFSKIFKDQVGAAGFLVLSKSENVPPEEFLAIKEALKAGDEVLFPLQHYSKWEACTWDRLLHRRLILSTEKETPYAFEDLLLPKEQELESFSIKDLQIQSPDELYGILEKLAWGDYGRIVRAKGYMGTTHFFRFEFVEGRFMITGMEKVVEPRVVIIGKNLNKRKIRNLFFSSSKQRYQLSGSHQRRRL